MTFDVAGIPFSPPPSPRFSGGGPLLKESSPKVSGDSPCREASAWILCSVARCSRTLFFHTSAESRMTVIGCGGYRPPPSVTQFNRSSSHKPTGHETKEAEELSGDKSADAVVSRLDLSRLEELLMRVPALASAILDYAGVHSIHVTTLSRSIGRLLKTESIAGRGFREAVLRHAPSLRELQHTLGPPLMRRLLDSVPVSRMAAMDYKRFMWSLNRTNRGPEGRPDLVRLGLVKPEDFPTINWQTWTAGPYFVAAMMGDLIQDRATDKKAEELIPYDEWLPFAKKAHTFCLARPWGGSGYGEMSVAGKEWFAEFKKKFFEGLDLTELRTEVQDLDAVYPKAIHSTYYPQIKNHDLRATDWRSRNKDPVVPEYCTLDAIFGPSDYSASSWGYVIACCVRRRGREHPELYAIDRPRIGKAEIIVQAETTTQAETTRQPEASRQPVVTASKSLSDKPSRLCSFPFDCPIV